MAHDQQQYERTQKLAAGYTKEVQARNRKIHERVSQAAKFGTFYTRGAVQILSDALLTGLVSGRWQTPSEGFIKENDWVFGLVVHPRFREAFLQTLDRVREFPCATSWGRRSFRSESYGAYLSRIDGIVLSFWNNGFIDADIRDILTGNLPEAVLCYLKTRETRIGGFAPEVLAYELDRGDPVLEDIVRDIINGEGHFSVVSRELIRGIVMSHNSRMHKLLCDLLLAARLQEGLRQAICEDADWGTREAFQAILTTIADHDLIRYSSVKRAVGTWLGLAAEETRDLDRISGKSLALVRSCLSDASERERCLASQDAMEIYIALWSIAFDSVEQANVVLDRISREGTHQQILAAGYFLQNLEDPLQKQQAAKTVLARNRDHYDILAVYLPHLIPCHRNTGYDLVFQRPDPKLKQYFSSDEEAREFCDWLLSVHSGMKKKELVFEPCVFPWNRAVLKRSELVEKAMVIAAIIGDQERIDALCPMIGACEAMGRDLFLNLMTMGKKTAAVRAAIVGGLADKSTGTRQAAFLRCKGLSLTAEEYLAVEDMLRLRYDDLRRNAMELLLKQSDDALEGTIRRLLGSGKTEKRTAALDLLAQLSKSGDRKHIPDRCMALVAGIANPTTQERVLIDALMPREASRREPLFTEADRYRPVIAIDDFATDCFREFMALFPDSQLEAQALAGVPVTQKGASDGPCPAVEAARKRLESLSDFFVAHETEHFEYREGYGISYPISVNETQFSIWDPQTGRLAVPRMDLWEQWLTESGATTAELMGMCILLSAQKNNGKYLERCGAYVASLYGPGFEIPVHYRYMGHMRRILGTLLCRVLSREQRLRIAAALGIWVARCLPEEMFLGSRGLRSKLPVLDEAVKVYCIDEAARENLAIREKMAADPVGHFIAHPQLAAILHWLEIPRDGMRRHIIPVAYQIFEQSFDATERYTRETLGMTPRYRMNLILDQLYADGASRYEQFSLPGVTTILYARQDGLISDRTMYYHLMSRGLLEPALKMVTSVAVMQPGAGETISSRCLVGMMRRQYEALLGKDRELDADKLALIGLCKTVADRLTAIVVEEELRRGDSPAEYSAYVTGIQSLSGAENFVGILSALGKDTLDRSALDWGSGNSRRSNLSHLLARCVPAAGDTAETLGALLRGTDITPRRLIEAALFSPAWIDIIGQYLELPGFKSACYYFMAHMNEAFDEEKKAVIARFSPLSEEELNQGAFDVQWFRSAFEQLGEEKFDLIYDAAKYISDGSKHTRARKYADAALGRLDVEQTEAAIRDKRNKDLLMAYAIIPLAGEADLMRRYLFLHQFLKESRQFGAQRSASEKKAVETALRNLATNAGFSDTMRLTLRMETRLAEEDRELFSDRAVGEWTFRLAVDDGGTAQILCARAGKALKSIPAKAKKDPYVQRLLERKKTLTDQYRRTRRMFEQAMEDGTWFTLEELRQLTRNRVAAPILARLVFTAGTCPGLFDGENLTDLHGAVLEDGPEARLTVAHPQDLYRSGRWSGFQRYIFDNRIVQPFKQVFRELYVKTGDELGTFRSLRYAGHQIQPRKAAACLKDRRWVADVEAGLQKVYYQADIVATIFALADWFTPADIEAPTLEYVAFFHRRTGKPLMIDEIPDVIFSEVMRDVDMAVSVAHVGGVDPETSHSTVEMRTAILNFTLPLLGLKNVELRDSHALIRGKLGSYSVHLGSGIVHQIGGTMLSVLPVHSQHRGRIFLPFVDDDPKTAEIISKIILFSEDAKLKDPTILSQIR